MEEVCIVFACGGPDVQQQLQFLICGSSAPGLRGEPGEDLFCPGYFESVRGFAEWSGENFGGGFQWRIEEDAAVCRGWPGFKERAFELNGLNVESGQFTSVCEFAADADFADSGEVIHIVFFN